jgi:hypothetical protein
MGASLFEQPSSLLSNIVASLGSQLGQHTRSRLNSHDGASTVRQRNGHPAGAGTDGN